MQRSALVKWFSILVFVLLILYVGLWFYSAKKIRDIIVGWTESKSANFSFDSLKPKTSIFEFGVIVKDPSLSNKSDIISTSLSSSEVVISYNPFLGKAYMSSSSGFKFDVNQNPIGSATKTMHKSTVCSNKESAKNVGASARHGLTLELKNIFAFFKKDFLSSGSPFDLDAFKVRYRDAGFDCKIVESGEDDVSASIMPTDLDVSFDFDFIDVAVKDNGNKRGVGACDLVVNLISRGSEYISPKETFRNPSIDVSANVSYQNKEVFTVLGLDLSKLSIHGEGYSIDASGKVDQFNTLTREFSGSVKFDVKNYKSAVEFIVNKYVFPKRDFPADEYNKVVGMFSEELLTISEEYPGCQSKAACKDLSFSIHRDGAGTVMVGKDTFASFFEKNASIIREARVILEKQDEYKGPNARSSQSVDSSKQEAPVSVGPGVSPTPAAPKDAPKSSTSEVTPSAPTVSGNNKSVIGGKASELKNVPVESGSNSGKDKPAAGK